MRVLTIQRAAVPSPERARYLEALNAKKAYYAATGCRFWAFEESGLPGAFIEFTEATDQATLAAAHRQAPGKVLDAARIYKEIDLNACAHD